MEIEAWHGTNQEFDRFDAAALGTANPNEASRLAFFFATSREVAVDYAQKAARTMVPNQLEHEERVARLIASAEAAMRLGDEECYEALILEAEDLETRARDADPAGAAVLRCQLRLDNPAIIDASQSRLVVDLAGELSRLKAAGHDGVILRDIHDSPSGETSICDHIAVFDSERIQILDREPAEVLDQSLELSL